MIGIFDAKCMDKLPRARGKKLLENGRPILFVFEGRYFVEWEFFFTP